MKRIFNGIRNRMGALKSSPNYIKEKMLFGLKKALTPNICLPIWVTTKQGAKIFLGKDVIDEYILHDLCFTMVDRYFPNDLVLKKGDTVIDVGGHHGLYAVELLARFPDINILSIEPDPEGVVIIKKHVQKNNAETKIMVIPYAIGLDEKEGFLTDNDDGSWGKTLETENSNKSIAVKVKTLNSVLNYGGVEDISSIKLVKSNCEGGEFELIPQMIEMNIKPNLIILMIHPARGDSKKLVSMLREYGYHDKLIWDNEVNPCWHFNLIK